MTNKDFPKSKGEFKRLICQAIDAQYENGFEPYLIKIEPIFDRFEFYSWVKQVKLSITFEKKDER